MTIFWDIDDTLYDQSKPVCDAIEEVTGRTLPDREAFYRTFHKYSNIMFRRTQKDDMDLDESRILRICYSMEDLGLPVSRQEAAAFQDQYLENLSRVQLSDTLVTLMEECTRAGVKMGILTNGPYEHQLKKVYRLGMDRYVAPEHVIISEEAGYAKPSIEIFQIAQQRLSASGEEIWMVGDSLVNDIQGAMAAGWHTLWFSRHGQDPGDIRPERTVLSEQEMLEWAFEMFVRDPQRPLTHEAGGMVD